MKTKILLTLSLLVFTLSCDYYRSGASKMIGVQGYCIWHKDKNGYQASYSKILPPSKNMTYRKCDDIKKCVLECQKIMVDDAN